MPLSCGAAALLFLLVVPLSAEGQAPGPPAADTVHVSPPTGLKASDRARIFDALERASPGDVVQFAPGTYVVAELIRVTTSQVMLLGYPDGTTQRRSWCAHRQHECAEMRSARRRESPNVSGSRS